MNININNRKVKMSDDTEYLLKTYFERYNDTEKIIVVFKQ